MIDNFALGLTHLLLFITAWRLMFRDDLDDEGPVDIVAQFPKPPETRSSWRSRGDA